MQNSNKNTESIIDFGELLKTALHHWWWYVVSVVLCIGLCFVYVRKQNPVFNIQTFLLVNQDEENSKGAVGGLGALMSSFSLGGGGGVNVEDEIIKLRSKTNMLDVVKRLGINKTYWSSTSFFKPKTFYYNNSPIEIELPQAIMDSLSVSTVFHISLKANGKGGHIEVKQGKDGEVLDVDFPGLPYMAKTPMATFRINPTKYYDTKEDLDFYATVSPQEAVAIKMSTDITIDRLNKKADGIYVETQDVNVPRAKETLDMIVQSYNERCLADKNENAQNTAHFIEERLLKLYRELETSETNIENYKRENQIVDATAEAEYIFKKKETVEGSMVELETRASVLGMIKDFLSSSENKYSLVPFTADIPEAPISAYNELILERMRIEANAKGNNSVLKNINAQIDAMRKNLISTLDRQIVSTRIALRDMNREAASSEKRMTGIPTMERELKALYRDQVIKNEIYGFLLQKREENELKISRNTPVGKVVDLAYADTEPVSPKPMVIYGAGFIFGLLIPSALIWYLQKRKEEENTDPKA